MSDPVEILADCLWEDSNRAGTMPVTILDHGHATDWARRLLVGLHRDGWRIVRGGLDEHDTWVHIDEEWTP